MKWYRVITRPMGLLEIYYSQKAYENICGFRVKHTLMINRNGLTEKYWVKDELESFFEYIRSMDMNQLKAYFNEAMELDREIKKIIVHDPLEAFKEFNKKFLKYWEYQVLAYYIGQALDKKQIKPIQKEAEYLRGFNSARAIAEKKYFPKLYLAVSKKTKVSENLLKYAFPEEILKNKLNENILKKRKDYYVWLFEKNKINFYAGQKAKEVEEKELFDIEKKVNLFVWKEWLRRPFNPFIVSIFEKGNTRKSFNEIGISNMECKAFLYQNKVWHESEEILGEMAENFKKYFKKHTIFDITSSLEKFHKKNKKVILGLVKEDISLEDKLKKVLDISTLATTYLWTAHGLEVYFDKILKKEVKKYIKSDADKFISDASFPSKKNAHSLMEEEILKGEKIEIILKKYRWLRVRNAFDDPFTKKDILDIKKNLKKADTENIKTKKVPIPKQLEKLFSEVRELVYFRTARTDVFYELLFLARPILEKVAKKYNVKFRDLKYFTIQSLVEGRPKKYKENFSCANFRGESIYKNEPIVNIKNERNEKIIKGSVAYKGIVRGICKIVKDVGNLKKVELGDILVTQMTFPSFIVAMKKASAFVTDEGGITCHAAIVAREMKKPCIIGTKIATQVLKDGDRVEVDADKGIVKILK